MLIYVRSLEFRQIAQRFRCDAVLFDGGPNVIERYLRFSAAFPYLHQDDALLLARMRPPLSERDKKPTSLPHVFRYTLCRFCQHHHLPAQPIVEAARGAKLFLSTSTNVCSLEPFQPQPQNFTRIPNWICRTPMPDAFPSDRIPRIRPAVVGAVMSRPGSERLG